MLSFDDIVALPDRSIIIIGAKDWCAPCRALGRVVEKLVSVNPSYSDRIHEFDIEDCSSLVARFDIKSIPTTFYVGAGVIDQRVGVQSESDLVNWLG